MLGSNLVKFLMPILKRQVDLFSFMKDYSSVLFQLKQYILCKKVAHWNENFWHFRVLGSNFVKFCMPILKRQLQILYPSAVSWKIIPLYFFNLNNTYFAQKEPIKMNFFLDFWMLGSNFVKFVMPILKWWVDTSPNFVSLFTFMKDYSSVLL